MNRSFIVAVLTVTLVVLMSTLSHAVDAPHGFDCANCHGRVLQTTGVKADPSIYSYICTTCHNSAGDAARMPMDAGSMSNYFGTTSGEPNKGSKSSHNWTAKTPYDPRARVVDSVNPLLGTDEYGVVLTGATVCLRCHLPKTNATKPFLRISNANDALCYECHLPRQVSSQTSGSHPVNYRAYSTAYKSNTTAFRRVPQNANPYNPTSNLANYFKSGKISCMTCHAPHYADSSSATLDNRSTAMGFGVDDPAKGLKASFQDSKGEMLRTDRYGATADSINICSSCHKESKNRNHNGKGQNIQCDHCHAAHVDYTADGSAPNLYLVRRDFSNMSTAKLKLGANKKAVYNSATSLRFVRADGNGICQVCHAVPHAVSDARKGECTTCHTHANGFAGVDCTSCHGQPPVTSMVGGPDGKSSQKYGLDENFTPHATHASAGYYNYACKNCHYDGVRPDSHNTLASKGSETFQSVFVETAGSIGDVAGYKNVATDYNTTTRSCSNVYCHSNGNPRNGTIYWKSAATPSWAMGKGQIVGQSSECISCHEYGNTLNTNAHYAHVSSVGVQCYVCHNATANKDGGIADRTKHANGAKDVAFATRPANFIGVFSASFNSGNASCTNTCHGVATPVWTDPATGACGTCHAVPATTGAHGFHFSDPTGPKLGTSQSVCANCHDFAAGNGKHANGRIDVKTCTPCHPGAAVWTNAASVTCESCHVGTASVVGSYTAPLKFSNRTGHTKYALSSQCTACHDATKNHIGAGPTEKRLLIAGNALCDSCHTTAAGKGLPTTRVDLPVHGGSVNAFFRFTSAENLANIASVRSDACAGCHDTHGTSNRMSIRTTINGLSVSYTGATPNFIETSVGGDGFYHGLCQVCHTKTKYFNRNAAPVTSHATGGCLACHEHKGKGHFAFEPGGTCNTCHGYPPAESMTGLAVSGNYSTAKFRDYTGGGGAHTVAGHIPKTAVASEQWTNCTNCHNNASHATGGVPAKKASVNVVVDPKFRFNNASTIVYSGNSCSNVSCHFRPSPNWVTGN